MITGEGKMKIEKAVTLPNFLITGAAKSGTTSLYCYLRQHPDIFMPDLKEPHFFRFYNMPDDAFEKEIFPNSSDEYVRDFEYYQRLFTKCLPDYKAVGEASSAYLFYHERTIPNIKKFLPDWQKTKIIIILRNPVEASFSHYLMYKIRGSESLSFEQAMEHEHERFEKGFDSLTHFRRFYYSAQVKAYLENFQNTKVFLYDDLQNNQLGLIQDMYAFLEVDSTFIPDTEIKYNATGTPKSMFLHNFLTRPNFLKKVARPVISMVSSDEKIFQMIEVVKRKNLNASKPVISEHTLARLTECYREDILRLQGLINRDLSHWLINKCQN